MSTRRFAALELTDGFGAPAETRHSSRIAGRWWMVAGTPEGLARADLRSGTIDFGLRGDGRLDLVIELEARTAGVRRITGTAAARVGRRGRFAWRVRGRMLAMSMFGWSYRFIAGDRLVVAGHGGSVASQPTYIVLARSDVEDRDAMLLLDEHVGRLGVTPEEMRDLIRFEAPKPAPVGPSER